VCGLVGALSVALSGCTRPSVRLALEAQRRADVVQQAVQEQQHEALCILLYRDLVHRLQATGGGLSEAQRTVISEVWNDRDLVEFWALQAERVRALRLVGVESKLAGDQSVVDLLVKAIEVPLDAAEQELSRHAGARLSAGED